MTRIKNLIEEIKKDTGSSTIILYPMTKIIKINKLFILL